MAKYIYQEIGGITNKGERIVKPRFVGGRQVSNEEFMGEVAHRCAVSKGTLQAVMSNIADLLPEYLAQGNSVRIDGLGLLTPSLTMRDDMPVVEDNLEGNEVQHNAQNVVFGTVHITPDKELVRNARQKCRLTHDRYEGNRRAMDTPYTAEQRLELARKHLDQSPILTVSDYMELTGLRHTMAARELRDWASDPESGIRKAGRGSHRYYTK